MELFKKKEREIVSGTVVSVERRLDNGILLRGAGVPPKTFILVEFDTLEGEHIVASTVQNLPPCREGAVVTLGYETKDPQNIKIEEQDI